MISYCFLKQLIRIGNSGLKFIEQAKVFFSIFKTDKLSQFSSCLCFTNTKVSLLENPSFKFIIIGEENKNISIIYAQTKVHSVSL